jgi:hypothetical protein
VIYSRGGNQVDKKKGKTYARRSSTGKKKKGMPTYFGAYVKTRFRKTGLAKRKKATGRGPSSYTTARHST